MRTPLFAFVQCRRAHLPGSVYMLAAFSNTDPPAACRAFRWFEPHTPLEPAAAPATAAR